MPAPASNQLCAVERVLRQGGRTPIPIADSASGSPTGSSLVPWLALDRAFPVKPVLAEEGDPFTFCARAGADSVRELALQPMEAGECRLPATGLNRLPPAFGPEDLLRDPLSFAARPLLAELGDRVLCFAIQRVLTAARCRGDVSRHTCASVDVLDHLSTEALMLGPHSPSLVGRKPVILLPPRRYRTLAVALSPRSERSELDRLETLPAHVRAFHGIPEDTSMVLASELVVGLLPRLMVIRDGDVARLLLGVDAHLQSGSVVVAEPEEPEAKA